MYDQKLRQLQSDPIAMGRSMTSIAGIEPGTPQIGECFYKEN